MAFTVKLKSDKRCFLAGDTFTLTVTLDSGEDPAPSNLTYTWTKDDKSQEGDTNTLTISDATSENAGSYKVTVRDTDTGDEATSNAVRMDEAELVVKITEPTHFYVQTKTDVDLRTTVSYSTGKSPSDTYTLHYRWEKDGRLLDNTSDTLTIHDFSDDDNGVYTVSVWGESEDSTDKTASKVMLAKMRVDRDVDADNTVAIGHPIILHYFVSEDIVGDNSDMPPLFIQYNWYIQREGQDKVLLGNTIGEISEGFSILPNGTLYKERATQDDHATFWCIAKLFQTIDGTRVEVGFVTSTKCQMNIVESLHTMFRYVHPLPWRKTSFIYIGWWVFDEIVKFNELDLEWRHREVYSRSRYAKDLETIAAAEEKYGDCICMESRNGYSYNASKFHHLDRETLERVLRIREAPPL